MGAKESKAAMTTTPPSSAAADPCHPLACAIQTCLANHQYQESRCRAELDAYKQCVERVKEARRTQSQSG